MMGTFPMNTFLISSISCVSSPSGVTVVTVFFMST